MKSRTEFETYKKMEIAMLEKERRDLDVKLSKSLLQVNVEDKKALKKHDIKKRIAWVETLISQKLEENSGV